MNPNLGNGTGYIYASLGQRITGIFTNTQQGVLQMGSMYLQQPLSSFWLKADLAAPPAVAFVSDIPTPTDVTADGMDAARILLGITPSVYEKTISFSDFTGPGATRTLMNVFTVPAGEILLSVAMRHTASWRRSTCPVGTVLTVIMELREHATGDPIALGLNVFQTPDQISGSVVQDLVGINTPQIDVNVAVQASAAPCSSFFPDSGTAILVFTTAKVTVL